jgi:hypothetical protein
MEEIFHNLGETEKGKIKKDDRLRFKAQYRVWTKHIFKYMFLYIRLFSINMAYIRENVCLVKKYVLESPKTENVES